VTPRSADVIVAELGRARLKEREVEEERVRHGLELRAIEDRTSAIRRKLVLLNQELDDLSRPPAVREVVTGGR
jgi:hypothetical protein